MHLPLQAKSGGKAALTAQALGARGELKVPDEFDVNTMIAIGKRGPKEDIPEKLRAMEAPNSRRPMGEMLFDSEFGGAFKP